MQAYLKRTYEDIEHLLRNKCTMRICKGIYVEDEAHLVESASKNRTGINVHFINHVSRCFKIATHDASLIDEIIPYARRERVDRTKFEFQMLLGVCEPLRDKLRGTGFNVRIYIPYGKDRYGCSTRRIKEDPSIAGHVIKAMFRHE